MLDPAIAVDLILDGDPPVLWSNHSQREVCRFLRIRGSELTQDSLVRLCEAIIAGPPRDMYRADIDLERWEHLKDHNIWLRLAKLRLSGAELIPVAENIFLQISARGPWRLAEDHSDEFPFYVGGGWVDKDDLSLDFDEMGADEFRQWAMDDEKRHWSLNGWEAYCDADPNRALEKLTTLGEAGGWPSAVWSSALWRFSESENDNGDMASRSAQLLAHMPLELLGNVHVSSARWLKSKRQVLAADVCWSLWRRIWQAADAQEAENTPDINDALNHAGGVLAEIIMKALGEIYPTVQQGEIYEIPEGLLPLMEMIAEENTYVAQLARVMLAPHMLYLYRLSPDWTQRILIARMAPGEEGFEPSIWSGYLWSPKIADDLFDSLKNNFFEILNDLSSIPENARERAVELFVLGAVPPRRNMSVQESKAILQNLEPNHVRGAAWMLARMLMDAGDKSATQWREVIQPWFQEAWPTNKRYKTSQITEELAWMAIEAGDAFPEVVAHIEGLLSEEEYPGVTIMRLEESGQHLRFPNEAKMLLDKIVGDPARVVGSRYNEVLAGIRDAME